MSTRQFDLAAVVSGAPFWTVSGRECRLLKTGFRKTYEGVATPLVVEVFTPDNGDDMIEAYSLDGQFSPGRESLLDLTTIKPEE